MARKQCFLVCPPSGSMARKQCFLVCPPSGNMARKQCFLVCPPSGNMVRKQCFLVSPTPSENMAKKQCFQVCSPLKRWLRNNVSRFVHLYETWLGHNVSLVPLFGEKKWCRPENSAPFPNFKSLGKRTKLLNTRQEPNINIKFFANIINCKYIRSVLVVSRVNNL